MKIYGLTRTSPNRKQSNETEKANPEIGGEQGETLEK